MQKASYILIRIGHILSIVFIPIAFIAFISSLLVYTNPEIKEAMRAAFEEAYPANAEALLNLYFSTLLFASISMLILGGLCLINAIITKKTMNYPNRNNYIACIIVGFLSVGISAVGAIIGLVALNRNNNSDY